MALIEAETLQLLEWNRLCQHLSTFSATKLGAIATRNLKIPNEKQECLELLAQTKEIYQLEQDLNTRWSFDGIHDIGNSLERAGIYGTLSGLELIQIATTLAGVRRLRRVIEDEEDIPHLKKLVSEVRTFPELEQEINRCLDEKGKVLDRASSKLANIRSQIKVIRDRIYHILQRILQKKGGAIQEAVITQRSDRFVIPVKAPQKDQIPGIVHDSSGSGMTLYIEPNSVIQHGNQLRQYQREEEAEIEAILMSLTSVVAENLPELELLLAVATALDVATAKARYSLWLEANPPRFIEEDSQGENTTLRQLRHPLLVWQKNHEQGSDVIPINVQIKPEIKVIAITGPNTGGKTVTLKTIGLAMLMAKVGMFVPAKEPVELPWFDKILADIGDEQSIEQSLSTFSGHIRRIIRVIEALEKYPQSLVLLDEVGAGTDPAEGSALAIALLQDLASRAKLTVATTHYGELKALKYQDSRFENASVEFDEKTLSPTYRLLWGIPGRSNALNIANRLGLKTDIIEKAQDLVGNYFQDINEIISGLEAQRKEQETKAEEAKKLLEQTENFYQEISTKAKELQERERELKQHQEKAITDAITDAKAEIAKVIKKLQQGSQTAQKAKLATDSLNKIAEEKLTQPKKIDKPVYKPKVGEKVRIPRIGQTGEVLSISESEEQLTVRFGIMKMTLGMTEIESLDGQIVKEKDQNKDKDKDKIKSKTSSQKSQGISLPTPPKNVTTKVRTSQNSVDIRGSRVAEAESDLERAIVSATNYGLLWIVHGKGTGRLRQGVHEFLQRHPQVKRFELAPQKEGGSGVTIAYLV